MELFGLKGQALQRPDELCNLDDWRKLNKAGDTSWLGSPIPKDLAHTLYPHRKYLAMESLSNRKQEIQKYEEEDNGSDPKWTDAKAVAHFWGAELDSLFDDDTGDLIPGFKLYVGDFVRLDLGEGRKGVCQVLELYQDPLGAHRISIKWFFSMYDDEVKILDEILGGLDKRQLWGMLKADKQTFGTEYELNVVEAPVKVVQVLPGETPPEDEDTYWWESVHGPTCYTFENPGDLVPTSRTRHSSTARLLRVMDLYAGGGGLGYLDTRTEKVEIRTDWAVDYEQDMRNTFKCNFQHAHAFASGTDEALGLFKMVFWLCQEMGVGKEAVDGRFSKPFAFDKLERCDDDQMVAPPCSLVLQNRACGRWRAGRQQELPAKAQGRGAKRKRVEPTVQASRLHLDSSDQEACAEAEVGGHSQGSSSQGTSFHTADEKSSRGEGEEGADASRVATRNGRTCAATGGGQTGGKVQAKSLRASKSKPGAKDGVGVASPKSAKSNKMVSRAEAEAKNTAWPAAAPIPKAGELEAILQVRLCEKGARLPKDSNVGAAQLIREIRPEEMRLEFKVRWSPAAKKYGDSRGESWLPRSALGAYQEQLKSFCLKLRRCSVVPFPGEVNLICGGPPCQGVSGNNRHAKMRDILQDVRNRQLLVFLDFVKWFKPNFVLMENVQDIMKKEEGKYVKYAMGHTLQMGYQIRLGLLAAGDFGVSQGRWRCFMWGALKNEEQLPAFPEATHNCRNFKTGVCTLGKDCQGGFLSDENSLEAHPPVLLGDVMADLPEVTNGELRERLSYPCDPKYVQQMWYRRLPQPWQTSIEERIAFRSEVLEKQQLKFNRELLESVKTDEDVTQLGLRSLNTKNPLKGAEQNNKPKLRQDGTQAGNHPFETITAALRMLSNPREAEILKLEMEAGRLCFAHERGMQIYKELQEYLKESERGLGSGQVLCDHRPLILNDDDYLRITVVPKRTRYEEEEDRLCNFRALEGVVNNADGTCCYGSQHAERRKDGTSGCKGGGTYTIDKRSNAHVTRIDQEDKNGWRGVVLQGCQAYVKHLPTMEPELPRWCVTFKRGKSDGRHGGFGRVHFSQIITTVIGRAEPHNLKLAHPTQDRVMTIRENARCQGFPDYHVFCADLSRGGRNRWVRNSTLTQRYQMIGNAVCPEVASALGRCLALAATGESPPGECYIQVPNPAYLQVVKAAREKGLEYFFEEYVREHPRGYHSISLEARLCAAAEGYIPQGGSSGTGAVDDEDEVDDDSQGEEGD